MKIFSVVARIMLVCIDFLGFGLIFLAIGGWWVNGFVQIDNQGPTVAVFKATVALRFAFVGYFKIIYQPRAFRSPLRFYFYTYLGFCAVFSYFYGVFYWFL